MSVDIKKIKNCIRQMNSGKMFFSVRSERNNMDFFSVGSEIKMPDFKAIASFEADQESAKSSPLEFEVFDAVMFRTKGGREAYMWHVVNSARPTKIIFVNRESVAEKPWYSEREMMLKKLPKFRMLMTESEVPL